MNKKNKISFYTINDNLEEPLSEEYLMDVKHEHIGFMAGCPLLDLYRKIATAPALKYGYEPNWLIMELNK